MNKPEALSGMVSDLIRRGLPVEYATRAADEFADHHRDLVEELRASGWSESQASDEASRRLGDSHALVKKTVSEYQRRYWCARWPLVTFLIGPIPALVAVWFGLANLVWLIVAIATKFGLTATTDAEAAFLGLPMEFKYAALVGMFLIVPTVVVYGFARLAKRAALEGKWLILAACLVGMFAGDLKWEQIGPGSKLVMTDRQTGKVIEQPKPDFVVTIWVPVSAQHCSWSQVRPFFFTSLVQPCQLLLPVFIAGLLLYRRQHAALSNLLVTESC